MHDTSLKYFSTVAEELNITRAAEILHLSQQALSAHILKLEEEYNTVFFKRNKGGLTLTPQGRRFYEYVKAVLRLEEQAVSDIADMRHGHTGSLAIGTGMTRAVTLLPPVIADFVSTHPDVKVSLTIRSSIKNELERKLLGSELDLIVVPRVINLPATIETAVLEQNWLCLSIPGRFIKTILHTDETLSSFAAMPLEEQKSRMLASGLFDRIPFVYTARGVAQSARTFLNRYAPHSKALVDLTGYENLFGAAFCGHAAVFTHNTLIRRTFGEGGEPDQLVYPIAAPEFPATIAAYYKKDTENPAVLAFLSELTDFAQKRRTPPPEEFFASLD